MSDAVVLDASATYLLLVPNPKQSQLQGMFDEARISGTAFHAPTLWLSEMTSSLNKAVHFGQLTEAEARGALAMVTSFDIELHIPDAMMCERAFDWTRRLNRAAAYDSFYLTLAEHLQCELWTVDRRLYNAASVSWMRLLG